METVSDWDRLVLIPLGDMFRNAIGFIPNIVSSLFILLLGALAARLAQLLLSALLKSLGFNQFSKLIPWHATEGEPAADSDERPLPHELVGRLAYWLVFLSFTAVALERLNLRMISFHIGTFVQFGVSLVVVTVLAVLGLLVSLLVRRAVESAAKRGGFGQPVFIAKTAQMAVVFSTALLCLTLLGVPKEALLIVLGATYLTLCIAFVISFGVGGASAASTLLNRWVGKKPGDLS